MKNERNRWFPKLLETKIELLRLVDISNNNKWYLTKKKKYREIRGDLYLCQDLINQWDNVGLLLKIGKYGWTIDGSRALIKKYIKDKK